MIYNDRPLRVLYSFPHRLGMGRICNTAWYEINSVTNAGAEMLVMAGDSVRPFKGPMMVTKTLCWGKLKLPYRLLGTYRTCLLHDWIVARRLPALLNHIDLIHAWPLGSLQTIRTARQLGIPVLLERPNSHTRFACDVVKRECERIGVQLPPGSEHALNPTTLAHEELEYSESTALLCPSDFVVNSFLKYNFPKKRLIRFIYGVDDNIFYPSSEMRNPDNPLQMLFVGHAAVRKGLHFALEAWLQSKAKDNGTFLVAGFILPSYRKYLAERFSHHSVKLLGHRNDIPKLMRQSDLFVLPSIEEGFGLVCTEAMASGCVPLVSDACTDLCQHDINSLVHKAGDVSTLRSHIDILTNDRSKLLSLRQSGLNSLNSITWRTAGKSLYSAYCLAKHTLIN